MIPARLRPWAWGFAWVGVVLLVGWLLSGQASWLRVVVQALIAAIAVVGLNFTLGYSRQVSLGQGAFVAVGAYVTAQITVHFQHVFLVALVVSIVLGALVGLVVGLPALRVRGHYLAFLTLAFAVVVNVILINWESVTGGALGLRGIPAAEVGPLLIDSDIKMFYFSAFILGTGILLALRLRESSAGRSYIALGDDDLAAACTGVNVRRRKIEAFCLSAAYGSCAGSLSAAWNGYIDPSSFTPLLSFALVIMAVIGGVGSIAGAVIGALIVTVLPELLRFSTTGYTLAYGVLVLAVAVLLPKGAVGVLQFLGEQVRLFRSPEAGPSALSGPAPAKGARLFADGESWVRAPAATGRGKPDDPILEVEQLSLSFGGVEALRELSFAVTAGHVHAVIGPNGAGKSSLVNVLSGINPPSSGEMTMRGRSITHQLPHQRTALGLSRTFQNIRLFPSLTSVENLMVAGHSRTTYGLVAAGLGTRGARRQESELRHAALDFLDQCGLAAYASRVPDQMSYSEQRRLEIARALFMRPTFLILDEPIAGLHSTEVEEVVAMIESVRSLGVTVMLIEHNMAVVMRLADHITVLNFGQKISDGAPALVRSDAGVIEAYLGGD